MKINFGVSAVYHCAGGPVENMFPERFEDYDSAFRYGCEMEPACFPTVYLILDDTYVFHCERSRVENQPYKVQYYESHNWGMVETMVWWKYFLANPYDFLLLATKKI